MEELRGYLTLYDSFAHITPSTKAFASHRKVSVTQSGCLSVFRSVFVPVEELLAQCGIGVTNETVRQ
ncbi:MAG: hypothetical protein NVS4B12_17530 [Ktedonobacteraceae bacterium]